MFIVQMTKDEIRRCANMATELWLEKFGSEDRPNYAEGKKNGSLQHDLVSNTRTIAAEMAVAKATNATFNYPVYSNYLHPYRKHLPDVGGNMEVRTVRTRGEVPIWRKDAGKAIVGCYVPDEGFFSEVEIYGWVMADDVIGKEEFADPSIGGWRYPLTSMTPFPEPTHLNTSNP
jgi:hypothetical protein